MNHESLLHLLRVQLFDHRLKGLLRLSAAPTKATQAEREKVVKEKFNRFRIHKHTEAETSTNRNRIFFNHVEPWAPPAERAVRLVHDRLQVSLSDSGVWEAGLDLQIPQLLLNLCVSGVSHQPLVLLSLRPPLTAGNKKLTLCKLL